MLPEAFFLSLHVALRSGPRMTHTRRSLRLAPTTVALPSSGVRVLAAPGHGAGPRGNRAGDQRPITRSTRTCSPRSVRATSLTVEGAEVAGPQATVVRPQPELSAAAAVHELHDGHDRRDDAHHRQAVRRASSRPRSACSIASRSASPSPTRFIFRAMVVDAMGVPTTQRLTENGVGDARLEGKVQLATLGDDDQ